MAPTREGKDALTEADARAYVAGGGSLCPYCGSDDLEAGRIEVDSGGAWQDVECAGCRRLWREVFALTGIDVLDQDGRYVDSLDGTNTATISDAPK